MENLLPQLLSFPPHPPPQEPLKDAEYDTQIKHLVQILNSVPASKLASGVPGSSELLDVGDRCPQSQWVMLKFLYRP